MSISPCFVRLRDSAGTTECLLCWRKAFPGSKTCNFHGIQLRSIRDECGWNTATFHERCRKIKAVHLQQKEQPVCQ